MQPAISPELIEQLEPYLNANTNISQLVEAAIGNYLSWQQFLSSIATGGNSDELSLKFNHLLIETRQAQADLRQLIKEANDRIGQQTAWTSRELENVIRHLAETNGHVEVIKKKMAAKEFSPSEVEVLQRFARSMGAAPSPFEQIFAPVDEPAQCTDGFCPVPDGFASTPHDAPSPYKAAIEPAEKQGRSVESDNLRDRLAKLNRKELGKLLTQYGIPHRNSENVVWRVEQMRDLLIEKMPAGEVVAISTETKRRGRPRKVA